MTETRTYKDRGGQLAELSPKLGDREKKNPPETVILSAKVKAAPEPRPHAAARAYIQASGRML